jgi:hypothetical protein
VTYSELRIGTPHPLAHGGLPRSRLVGISCFPACGLRSLITAYCELAGGLRDTFNFRSKTYSPYGAGLYLRSGLHFSCLAPRLPSVEPLSQICAGFTRLASGDSASPIGRHWHGYLDQSRTSYERSLSLASVQWTRTTLISVFSP